MKIDWKRKLTSRKAGTDEVYDEAIDADVAPFTYEETDEPMDNEI